MYQVFVSILLVTLASVLATGLLVRTALSRQFETYLTHAAQGRGMGRMILGAAEQTFIGQVDVWILIAAVGSVVFAALVAFVLARRIVSPIVRLTAEADEFARGDLTRRAEVAGPAEVGELADAFNSMADSLSQAEVLRRRMVADVAHELRNPIAALRAQLEGVSEGIITMDQARAVSLVEDVGHLSRLVSDLQELSMAEAGRLSYMRVDFDLSAAVASEVERFRDEVGHTIELVFDGASSQTPVHADELRIAQVLRNLLSNALRHTAEGRITVRVRRDGSVARIEVVDTGEGIAQEDLPHVFERFYRADTARSTDTGGVGIGLAIARTIVEDHDGRVFAASEPGKGATVGFELPIAKVD